MHLASASSSPASMAKPHHFILLLLLLLLLCTTQQFSSASSSDYFYDVGDDVSFFVNKVGPFNNPRFHLFSHCFSSSSCSFSFSLHIFIVAVRHMNTMICHSAPQVSHFCFGLRFSVLRFNLVMLKNEIK